MSDRITEIKASELTLEHLWLSVEVTGRTPVALASHSGQLNRFRDNGEEIYVLLGPGQNSLEVTLRPDSTVKLLDAPTPDRAPMNFGAAA